MGMSTKKRARVARRVTIGVAAGTAAAGLAAVGIASAARKTEVALPKLPAPGATIEVDLASKGIDVAFAGQRVNTGPLQGKATFEIESNKGDPSSVRTKVSEFYLTSPAQQGGITVAIAPNARSMKDHSVLRLIKPGSPKFHHTLQLALNITVRKPEMLGLPAETDEPLSLTAKEPVKLVGRITGFPAKGALYKLESATPLSLPAEPDSDVASIRKFPVRLEGL